MRRATPDDIDAVNRLLRVGFDRLAIPDDLERPELHVFLTDDDQALGAVYFARDVGRWAAHATSWVVHPDARGRGVSRELVAETRRVAGEFAAEHGPMRLFGYSNPSRGASIHLLASDGWKHIGDAIGEHGSHLWAVDYDEHGNAR